MYRLCLLIASTLLATNAMADTSLWYNTSSGSLQGGSSDNRTSYNYQYGNYLNLNDNGIGLTITGWSDTGYYSDDKYSGDDSVIRDAHLQFYGNNLAIINRDENGTQPQHSADNMGGDHDAFLLEFDQAINLSQFGIGWAYDSGNPYADMSLLAYQGQGSASLDGSTWNTIAQSWTSVGNYSDVDNYSYQSISTSIKSKYWLISAYNPIFNGPHIGSGYLGDGNDGFKLTSLAGTKPTTSRKPPTDVPEPGMLALFSLGLLSLATTRRKRAQ